MQFVFIRTGFRQGTGSFLYRNDIAVMREVCLWASIFLLP